MPSVQVLDGRKLAAVRKGKAKSAKAGKKDAQLKSQPTSSKKKQSKGFRKKHFDSKSADDQFETPLPKKSKLSKKYTECTEETVSKGTEGTQRKRGDTEGTFSGSSRSQKHTERLELQADDHDLATLADDTGHRASRRKKKRKGDQEETIEGDDGLSTVTIPQDDSMMSLGVKTVTRLETEADFLPQTVHEKERGKNPTLGLPRHAIGKSHPSKFKKARSGVVAVEEIRPRKKRKKQYSPSRFTELLRTEIGTGQESMWT